MLFNYNFNINIKELQTRTIYAFISIVLAFVFSFNFRIELFFVISKFFLCFEDGFIYTNLLDPLVIYIKICVLFTIIFSFPVIFYIYAFYFFKAIYNFYIYYITSYVVSFYFGGFVIFIISYFKIFPIILKFLIEFQRLEVFNPLKIVLKATIGKYVLFFFSFIISFFIIFILCNVFLFFIHFSTILKDLKYRRFLYLFILILLFVLAPPDILVQLIIFPFMILCVEVIIYFVSFWYNLHEIYVKK